VDCPTDLTVCPGHLREFLEFFSSSERRRLSIAVRKAGQLNTCATFNAAELLMALSTRQTIVDDYYALLFKASFWSFFLHPVTLYDVMLWWGMVVALLELQCGMRM
jgi:hypothetical protein